MGIALSFNYGLMFGIEAIEQEEDSPFSWEIYIALSFFNIHLFGMKPE